MTARHVQLDDALAEFAALFALDLLDGPEKDAFEQHLATCEVCRDEVARVRPLAGDLALLTPERDPSPHVREELMLRLSKEPVISAGAILQPWKAWVAREASPMTTIGKDDSSWEPTAIPGIETRRLHLDAEHDRVTMLVRMAPGTQYPAHVHGGDEECFVLAGDIRVGNESKLGAGDYQLARGGTRHPAQSTEGGCKLLIISSLNDEIVD